MEVLQTVSSLKTSPQLVSRRRNETFVVVRSHRQGHVSFIELIYIHHQCQIIQLLPVRFKYISL
jgi:hypothetical protein